MVRDGQIAKDKYYFSALDAKPIFITSKVSADRDGRMEVFSHSLKTKVSILPAQAKMLFVGDEVNAKVLGIGFSYFCASISLLGSFCILYLLTY
jgi:ribonuclease R